MNGQQKLAAIIAVTCLCGMCLSWKFYLDNRKALRLAEIEYQESKNLLEMQESIINHKGDDEQEIELEEEDEDESE